MGRLVKVATAAVVLASAAVLAPGPEAAGSDEGWITTWAAITSSSAKYSVKLSLGRRGPAVSLITPRLLGAQESRIADLLLTARYDEAITALDAAIDVDSQNDVSYVNRGFAWAMKGDLDRAIADFDEAIRLNPKQDAAHSNRGIAWREKEEIEKALADYDTAIRLQPNHGAFYNNRGSAWLAKGDADKAIADCNNAMRLDPKMDHVHYYNRGLAWRSKWELDKAIADYTEALRLDPTSARIYAARCDAWRLNGVLDKAVADANEATRLDPQIRIPNDPRRHHSKASEASERSRAGFDADFDAKRRAGLGLSTSVSDLGFGTAAKTKRDDHLVTAGAVAADQPDARRVDTFVARGIARNNTGEFLQAIGEFLEALRLDPTCSAAYLNRGIAWRSMGDYGRALADFDEAARLDPNDRRALDSNARLCATCPDASHRDGARAVALATRACELSDWKEPSILDTLAAACAEAGDFDAAQNWQQLAIELTGGQPCPDRAAMEEQRARLARYQTKRPFRAESGAK